MPGQAVFMGYPHIRGTVVAAEWQPSFIHLWPGIGCPDFLRPFEDTPPRPSSLPSNIGELGQRKNKQGAETHVFVLAGAGKFSTTID